MMRDPEISYAVVQFDADDSRAVRQVVAPFPDVPTAAAFAVEAGIRNFAVGPVAFAVPPTPAGWRSSIPAPRGAAP
jgi:hypothetical protein